MKYCLRKPRHFCDITTCVFVGLSQRGLEVKRHQVVQTEKTLSGTCLTVQKATPLPWCHRGFIFFTAKFIHFRIILGDRTPTWHGYVRHRRAKPQSSRLERATKWKHSANVEPSAQLQHRGIRRINGRLANFPPPRAEGPGGTNHCKAVGASTSWPSRTRVKLGADCQTSASSIGSPRGPGLLSPALWMRKWTQPPN